MSGTTAVIVKGYPRLSETFIAQELHGLERRGVPLLIVSLRRPTDAEQHPIHGEIAAPVLYLPEYLHRAPFRVLRGWLRARRLPGYRTAYQAWRADLARDRTLNRVRRFWQALVLARELPRGVTRLHAHFLHTPASVARYASLLLGLPWSCSAHAKDIWTTPAWDKRDKLAAIDWLVTCTRAGADHLAALAADPAKVELIYHGLELERCPDPPAQRPPRDGSDPADPVVILSTGRLVEKKGYADLLAALARLPASLSWRLVHIGGGPLRLPLKRQAEAAGLADRIAWLGPKPRDIVFAQYQRADLFALASRVAADGDRDGVPNVLLEAQSQGLACVSTTAGGIGELIESEVTGILVPPGDAAALAVALERLIRSPALRARLGAAGLSRLRERFTAGPGLDRLAARFGQPAATSGGQCASRSMRR